MVFENMTINSKKPLVYGLKVFDGFFGKADLLGIVHWELALIFQTSIGEF
jgi:hypothetical protein